MGTLPKILQRCKDLGHVVFDSQADFDLNINSQQDHSLDINKQIDFSVER